MELLAADLDRATIPSLGRRMADGSLTSAALTSAYLARIAELDTVLKAVVAVDPTASRQAEESDRRRALGRSRGPLDGIPVLLKDNIDTAGLATTAGSRALPVPPREDAELVTRLRSAGAVVLGKTNMTEWGNFRSPWATSGWSAVGGQTVNAHVLDRTPCGSSSGSAVAVAASLAQVAVGTETNGSIVSPAGHSGVVGFKPTPGRVSNAGIVPITALRDTAGPLARHVVDAALLVAALEGSPYGFTPGTLRGARVGVWRKPGFDDDVDRVLDSAVAVLRQHGATVVDVEPQHLDQVYATDRPAMLVEFRHDLEQYLRTRSGAPRTIRELIELNEADPVELSLFGQELLHDAAKARPLTDPAYRDQRATATDLAHRCLDDLLTGERLDVVMAPTNGPSWPARGADPAGPRTAMPAAVGGHPNVSVPAGFAGPLPLGVSFTGARGADGELLRFAAAFEEATRARRAPGYLPTLP
ncbi:amidase family protein [Lentzea sp.]|uniref:amidase family protein n=1 Tax=Lentzea sp. TaxID=56099 RepID=UPI002ED09017